MIRCAATGPTPSILANSSCVQELRRVSDEFGVAGAPGTGSVGATACTWCMTSVAGASTTGAGVSATGSGISTIGAGLTTGVTVSATGTVFTGSTGAAITSTGSGASTN